MGNVSKKLPVNNFDWQGNASNFHEKFMKNYGKTIVKGSIFEVDVKYSKSLHSLRNDLPFLP